MTDRKSVIDTINKMIRLSEDESTTDGEKRNARVMANRLIDKYNITEDEFDNFCVVFDVYKYKTKHQKKLFVYIACYIKNQFSVEYRIDKTRRTIYLLATLDQHKKIKTMYRVLSKKMFSGINDYVDAFILKNDLLVDVAPDDCDLDHDYERELRLAMIMLGINKTKFDNDVVPNELMDGVET